MCEVIIYKNYARHPGYFFSEPRRNIYVNVPDKREIEVFDLEKNTVIDIWMMSFMTQLYGKFISVVEDDILMFLNK